MAEVFSTFFRAFEMNLIKQMKLNEYNSLEIHQKARLLESHSVFLKSYSDEDTNASLYVYDNFYIEVWWDSNTHNLIQILAFRCGVRLDKYLEQINLTELYHLDL